MYVWWFLIAPELLLRCIVVPSEMPIIMREHFNRWYSLLSYYLAVTFADIPIQVSRRLGMIPKNIYFMLLDTSHVDLRTSYLFSHHAACGRFQALVFPEHVCSRVASCSKLWTAYWGQYELEGKKPNFKNIFTFVVLYIYNSLNHS